MSGQSKELVRLLTLPRGREGEEFRISVDEFSPDDGDPKQYTSIRVWFKGKSGDMLPGKVGCTVRRAELEQTIAALQQAARILSGKESVPQTIDPRQQQLPAADKSGDMGNF